jgi:tRNA (cytidine32/guanosine34-2'-O)-methyltransferase
MHAHDSCDIFRQAREQGTTTRLDGAEATHLAPPMRAVDLCAAPGSWSQVLVREVYQHGAGGVSTSAPSGMPIPSEPALARIVSVDLQEMSPLPGVCLLRGDITSRVTADAIIGHFHGASVDLVVCDGAPDVTGMHEIDEYCQSQLLLSALMLSIHLLRPGNGIFVAKIFVASAYPLLASQLELFFESVSLEKPPSSRPKSAEHFVVCKRFRRAHGFKAVFADTEEAAASASGATLPSASDAASSRINRLMHAYLRCGDLAPHDQLDTIEETPVKEAPAVAPLAVAPLSFTRFLVGLEDEM